MNATPTLLALALTLLTASGAFAGEKKNEKNVSPATTVEKPKATQAKPACKEQAPLTGSYIKKDVNRKGLMTDGQNPVFVLDQHSIQVSGASDLSQVLLRTGFRR